MWAIKYSILGEGSHRLKEYKYSKVTEEENKAIRVIAFDDKKENYKTLAKSLSHLKHLEDTSLF